MKIPANGAGDTGSQNEGLEKKSINQELWQACAGPLANLPPAGTHVVYFPQGHSEQVAASMKKDVDYRVPSYPNLSSMILCLLHNVTLHADPETDEVYAQMTLQPVSSYDKEALLRSDLALKSNKPQTEFFCKTLTASDTSTHGGFSVPRRAAEKIFPSLDFSMQPPAQEIVAKDLHDNVWKFRHIYRGQPKRHLLTTGWSLFVSGKRLFAGDSVLFIRDEKQQLLLGIRRANRQPTNLSSSVLSSDSMHIGILAAAAHAAANNSSFNVFYNPRASPSEFVIPLAKYYKAVYGSQLALGMRFRMMFETEDSGTRRYMGTITGINDLDPVRWKNSQWRNLQVGWDESTAGERRNRVSIWEIEPVTAPFFICPPPFFRPKRPRQPGMLDDEPSEFDNIFKRTMPWLGDDTFMKDSQPVPGLSLAQWMNMQQNASLANSVQSNYVQNLAGADLSRQLGLSAPQTPQPNNLQFNAPKLESTMTPSCSPLQQLGDIAQESRQNMMNQNLQTNQVQMQPSAQIHQQMQITGQNQQQSVMQPQISNQTNQQLLDRQIQLQQLQNLQQQQQQQRAVLTQQSSLRQIQTRDQQKQLLDVSQGFSRSIVQTQTLASQPNVATNGWQPSGPQQQKIQPLGTLPEISGHMGLPPTPATNHVLPAGNNGANQSGVTDDVPSCSTSPSSNNCPSSVQPTITNQAQRKKIREDMAQSASTFLNPSAVGTISANLGFVNDLHKSDVKPSVNVSKTHIQGFFTPQTYLNGVASQPDYLDTSSSTSACISQHDVHLQHNSNPLSYHPQSMVHVDHGNNNAYETNIDDSLLTKAMVVFDKDFSNNISSGGILTNYENSKDAQHDLSSAIVSQSFGVPDMAFNGIDPAIDDGSFMNNWTAQPQFQRMRTFTKVYKRGAVGRSIDIARYSGYDELKQDLARRFGIEGQLEERQRVGWKLVYVDHENDVLLVGDDPWEEFVSCVRCIKILSPSEVQQMSLDGDFGNSVLPNQACSSSDGGNA